MIILKNVLVATDFEEASDAALVYGRALARTFGESLHLLDVTENQFLRPSPADPAAILAAQLRSLHERLTVEDERSTAEDRDATIDLIVMGTHGRRAMAQLLAGSVAERVVRTAPCPVLTCGIRSTSS